MKVSGATQIGIVVSWLLVAPAAGWSAEGHLVQQIGEPAGASAEAVAAELSVVPLSPRIDPRTTPILLASGKAYIAPRPGARKAVGGLTYAERQALRLAYRAGQTIAVLNANSHDVEALHTLLRDGAAHRSGTHPSLLAYTLRREENIPSARVVTDVGPAIEPEARAEAWQQAIGFVIDDLTRPPLLRDEGEAGATSNDWADSPVQKTVLTSLANGVWNTPLEVYALHSCQADSVSGLEYDYYLVNTGGDWTPTKAQFQSASFFAGQIQGDFVNGGGHTIDVEWQAGREYCKHADLGSLDQRICQYIHYPTSYYITIEPPSAPRVTQINAAPEATQGLSTNYTSGFSFSLGGSVNVSGNGPSAGIQAGISWSQTVTTLVPPLLVLAGDIGNQGAYTRYKYCDAGSSPNDCVSYLQMAGQIGACSAYEVGDPQNGQTPEGRLSDVAQSVNWQVDPASYVGDTFDVTVTWQADLVTSTANLWTGIFCDSFEPHSGCVGGDPTGACNIFGCGCSIYWLPEPAVVEHTFNVPYPSRQCPPSSPRATSR